MPDFERLRQIETALSQHAQGLDTDCIWWISGGKDEYVDRCYACAKKRLEAIPAKRREREGLALGGDNPGHTSDTSPACEDCGKLLRAALSPTALGNEVDHFEENPPSNPLTQADAFSIMLMVEQAVWMRKTEQAALVDAIQTIAEQAVLNIPPAAAA